MNKEKEVLAHQKMLAEVTGLWDRLGTLTGGRRPEVQIYGLTL